MDNQMAILRAVNLTVGACSISSANMPGDYVEGVDEALSRLPDVTATAADLRRYISTVRGEAVTFSRRHRARAAGMLRVASELESRLAG